MGFAPGLVALPLCVEDDAVGLVPGGGRTAEARREVFADEPPPLRGAPLVVVEDAAVVEEDDGGLHSCGLARPASQRRTALPMRANS